MENRLELRHASAEALARDFEENLRKGRAFVPGPAGVGERAPCTLCLLSPDGERSLCLRAEAVWIDPRPEGGTGLSFVEFDAATQSALRQFVASASCPPSAASQAAAVPGDEEVDGAESSRAARNLHDRVRDLDLAGRDALGRQGSLPERVALERRYGSSVWEALLHNPQITPREVLRIAKSPSLPSGLANLIAASRAWTADPAINQALLANPRTTGVQLERVLRALPQADLVRISEQSSLRMQVRQAAKRLIRR